MNTARIRPDIWAKFDNVWNGEYNTWRNMAILADSQWGYSPSEKSFKAFFRSDIVKPGVHVCPGCHMSPGEVTSVPRLDWARLSAINGPEMIWKVWAVIHAGRLLANMEEVEMLKVKLSWIFDIPAAAAVLPGPVPTTRHPPIPGHGGIWPYYAWSLQLLHTAFQSPQ